MLPPIGKQKRFPPLLLTVLHACEPGVPKDRPAIDCRRITDLPVDDRHQAIEKLDWYARWGKIEVFHHILASGCRAEHERMRTAERMVELSAVLFILVWRLFWTTMVGLSAPRVAPNLAITDREIALLDRRVPNREPTERTLSTYVMKIARIGGYPACSLDPPPGNLVIWRGFGMLADITLGSTLARA